MNEKIEIPFSKKKLYLGVIGSIVFVVLGVLMFLIAAEYGDGSERLLRNEIVLKMIGGVGVLFFGAIGIFLIIKLSDKRPGLVLDASGITDNSHGASAGFIPWSDITQITTKQVMATKFLLIHVKKPEAFISKAESKMKARLMQANLKTYGTPLSITSNSLTYNFKALEDEVHSAFKKYKR
jgi:hypothetical protein